MSGVATAARHSGGAAGKGKVFEGEIIHTAPHGNGELTTVTATVNEVMPKGSVLRVVFDNQSFDVDMNKEVPAGTQLTMHVPSATSKMALTGVERGTEFQALAARAPLVKAAAGGNWAKVKKLVKKGNNVNVQDHEGKSPLWHACAAGHKETVRLLLNAKASVDLPDAKAMTPLMRAVVTDECEIVRMLLQHKADMNFTDHNKVSALIFGASTDSLPSMKLLMEAGCDLDALTVNKGHGEGMQLSALMAAARSGKVEMLRQMIAYGAALDLPSSSNGWTAFHIACEGGEGEMVAILVTAGCNTSLKDVLGRTGKDLAEENGHADVVARLRALVVARMREQLMKQQQQQAGGASDAGTAIADAAIKDELATAAVSKLLEPEPQRGSTSTVLRAGGGSGQQGYRSVFPSLFLRFSRGKCRNCPFFRAFY